MRRFRVMSGLGLCSRLALLAASASLMVPRAWGWDGENPLNPTHPTHSYMTEWAIDQLKATQPELDQYRDQLIRGANMEVHELPLKNHPVAYGVDVDAKRQEHRGTNPGCYDVLGWWKDSFDAYQAANKEQAHFLLGILLHLVEDMGVPAHANGVYHQAHPLTFDNLEWVALWNWKPVFDDPEPSDPGYLPPSRYYYCSRDWTRRDAPDYHSTSDFALSWEKASPTQRDLLSQRLARSSVVAKWALMSAGRAFASGAWGPPNVNADDEDETRRVAAMWQIVGQVVDDLDVDRKPEYRPTVERFLVHVAWSESGGLRERAGQGAERSFFQITPGCAGDGCLQAAKYGDDEGIKGLWIQRLAALSAHTPDQVAQAGNDLHDTGEWKGNFVEACLTTSDLFGAYLARIYLTTIEEAVPPDNRDQADYWADHWLRRSISDEERQQFVDDAERLDKLIAGR